MDKGHGPIKCGSAGGFRKDGLGSRGGGGGSGAVGVVSGKGAKDDSGTMTAEDEAY